MTLTIGYVRVSTEDQVDYSPEAQASRCREFARQQELGALTIVADEGWSGKNLDRPGVRRLIELVEAGQVARVIVWRLDRLSRDTRDLSELVRLFEQHCVTLHSLNEGVIDLATATGRMQVGMHGVIAQFQREQIIENVRLGMDQAAKNGRWLNRAPTGYEMVNGYLVPDEHAPLVRWIFDLRVRGASYGAIEAEVGISYSTVRQILRNRVYLGEVRLRDRWFQGIHEALVTKEQFDAVRRAHTPGRRRGRDVLSGKVRCGLCGRIVSVGYNERAQALYRCWHRGSGCRQPGRSAMGLQRAVVLGLQELANDRDLQAAIRAELAKQIDPETGRQAFSRKTALSSLLAKQRKLLDLHYDDQITAETFAGEEKKLALQIEALRSEEAQVEDERIKRDELSQRFEEVARVLSQVDLSVVWRAGTQAERRVLVEELVEAVVVFPDHLEVRVMGAPPLNVTLSEVGLREPGIRTCVSEGGLEPPRPCGHQPLKLARLPIPPLRQVTVAALGRRTADSTRGS